MSRRSWLSPSRAVLVAAVLFAGGAVTAAAAAALASAEPASPSVESPSVGPARPTEGTGSLAGATGADGTDILATEVEALLAGGVAPDDPKVTRLQDDLAALMDGATTPRPREPGVDLTDVLGTRGGGARSAATETEAAVAWDDGAVECEPLPADILAVGELTEARCVVAPQPDGTSRYVAVSPDGTVRVVRFGPDGAVTRQEDRQIEATGEALRDARLDVDEAGDVIVSVAVGSATTTIDLD